MAISQEILTILASPTGCTEENNTLKEHRAQKLKHFVSTQIVLEYSFIIFLDLNTNLSAVNYLQMKEAHIIMN